jgi:putative transposase
VKRAFKYRFYPTAEQAVEERTRAYRADGRHITYPATSAMLAAWKRTDEPAFLADVSSVPLQQALRHPHAGFTNFFATRTKYPKFKSRKKSRASAEYTRSAFRAGRLTLAKMSAPLNIVWSRPLPDGAVPSTVTVSRDASGRWFVSPLCRDVIERPPPSTTRVGLDVGLTCLTAPTTGEKIADPRHERRDRRRLARAQRALSRKAKGSVNEVARAHARISDRRRDFLHKLSTRLVRENQTVVIEGLNVRNMVKNRSLARAISDAAWGELRSMLEYKADWYGRDVVVVDRWFPSGKTCSSCGYRIATLPLGVREWTRPIHDRDVNAARDILAAGPAERGNACGGPVRPEPRTRRRRGPPKQETRPAREGLRPLRSGGVSQPQLSYRAPFLISCPHRGVEGM